jgi:hypothetical protein
MLGAPFSDHKSNGKILEELKLEPFARNEKEMA